MKTSRLIPTLNWRSSRFVTTIRPLAMRHSSVLVKNLWVLATSIRFSSERSTDKSWELKSTLSCFHWKWSWRAWLCKTSKAGCCLWANKTVQLRRSWPLFRSKPLIQHYSTANTLFNRWRVKISSLVSCLSSTSHSTIITTRRTSTMTNLPSRPFFWTGTHRIKPEDALTTQTQENAFNALKDIRWSTIFVPSAAESSARQLRFEKLDIVPL